VTNSCCYGLGRGLAFGRGVGMLGEQSNDLNLVEIEKGFHRVPALDAAEHRSEATIFALIIG